MEDIAVILLKQVEEAFKKAYSESSIIASTYKKVRDGTATYEDANAYSIEVGKILANAYSKINSGDLPNGRMYYNIAHRLITPTMSYNYDLISDMAADVQNIINEKAKIGIKPIVPDLNTDKVNKIVQRVADSENYDDISWILDEPIKTFSQSIVDDSIRVNAEFHAKSGMTPKIIRRTVGRCCEWCSKLEGIYSYPDVPKDVYRRHERCRCTVDYNPGKGRVQNVWTKNWNDDRRIIYQQEDERKKPEDYIKRLPKGKNVTPEYMRYMTPNVGEIKYGLEYDSKRHKDEIEFADWILKTFGGNIELLEESRTNGIKMPDYIWNGKLWDLKTVSTEKSANSAVRKGLKQIKNNPGGIFLNYGNNDISLEEVEKVIDDRVKLSNENSVDIMIIMDQKLIKVIRYKK